MKSTLIPFQYSLSLRRWILFFCLIAISGSLFAQNQPPAGRGGGRAPAAPATPLPVREVSGVVRDSSDHSALSLIGVRLTSPKDTLTATTNSNGVFVFKGVKSPEFTISISPMGYGAFIKKFYYAYTSARLVLDPFLLAQRANMLDVVEVKGPTITYKTDTVEYRASDYKVRENATMEELLKKMEGIEVDKDGNVTAQGVAVTRARLNGKNVQASGIADLIRDLPAEIAEKVQIVDDYGDQAELTGIKDGDPQKVLNIVTRRDKSVSNRGSVALTKGNNDGYNTNISGTRQNGNQNIMVRGSLNNTVTGIAASGSGNTGSTGAAAGGRGGGGGGTTTINTSGATATGGSGIGTRQNGAASISYGDDLSKKISLTGSYTFSTNNSNALNNSTSEKYQTILGSTKLDTVYSVRDGNTGGDGTAHSFDTRMDYKINPTTRLIVNPTFSTNSSGNSTDNSVVQTGGSNTNQKTVNSSSGSAPNYSITSSLAHRFGTKTNVSLQINASNTGNLRDQSAANRLLYYNPASIAHELLKDSLVNRLINTDNENANYRASTTFSQGLNATSRIEFNGQINYRGYDNSQRVNDVTNSGPPVLVDRLSKIYDYSFTETRLALNYRRGNNTTKFNYSLGLTAVPSVLKGESQTLHNTTERRSFNLIPITRIEYKWTSQKNFTLNYSGTPREPTFDQIQDVPDETNPSAPIIGNPNLKTAFSHSITGTFRDYITKSRITIQTSLTSNFVQDQVTTNRVQLTDVYNSVKNETRFENKDGNYSYRGSYTFAKRFRDNTYGIKLDGNVNDSYSISMYNSVDNIKTTWQWAERLTLLVSPNEWLEINPYVSYDFTKSNYSLPVSNDSRINSWAMNVDGRVIIHKNVVIGYDASKNFVNGLNASINSNPLIVNAYITREFFKRKNGAIRLNMFDLLDQNNYVSRVVSDNGITDTQTNTHSRYLTLSLSWRPARYSGGTKGRTAEPRRGDGSFVMP